MLTKNAFPAGRITIEDEDPAVVTKPSLEYLAGMFTRYKLSPTMIEREVGVEMKNSKGKFLKRLQKFLHERGKERDIPAVTPYNSLADSIEKARLYLDAQIQTPFKDIAFEFGSGVPDWEAGDFGDRGSCFFNNSGKVHEHIANLFKNNDVRHIKFFKKNKGIGRAWLLVGHSLNKANKPSKRVVLFNTYGLTRQKMALILSEFWGVPHRSVTLSVGPRSSNIYINANTGILFGPKIDKAKIVDNRVYTYLRSAPVAAKV
jgi:hypothetical protein